VQFIVLYEGKGGKLGENEPGASDAKKRPANEQTPFRGMGSALMMLSAMSEWRYAHPRATLREIEEAMDERLAQM
jgi:hypothetical protein